MAHDINRMVYAGATPWHGLGTPLPANSTWEDIRDAAGFYAAEKRPLFLADGTRVPDRMAVVRTDTGAYLGTVGEGYEVLQFSQLAEAGVYAAGGVEALWHTAGTLGEAGARGWLLGELPHPMRVLGDRSETRKYVLLTSAHDGTGAAVLMNCATRVVCRNTLGTALREADGARWSIRHTRSAGERLKSAAEAFRRMSQHYAQFEQLANAMVRLRFSEAQHAALIDTLLPVPDDGGRHPRLVRARDSVRALYETFEGHEGLVGTAWGAFQAWTEFVDHRRYEPTDDRARFGRHLDAQTFGAGADLKARALTGILQHVGLGAGRAVALA